MEAEMKAEADRIKAQKALTERAIANFKA